MVETILPNPSVEKLRQVISTCHFLKQAKGFELINSADYEEFITKLNDKAHDILNEIVNTISL